MKKWGLVLALFLAVIAIGGLTVLFRLDGSWGGKDDSSSSNSSSVENHFDLDLDKEKVCF